jgi:hypothetical protein
MLEDSLHKIIEHNEMSHTISLHDETLKKVNKFLFLCEVWFMLDQSRPRYQISLKHAY